MDDIVFVPAKESKIETKPEDELPGELEPRSVYQPEMHVPGCLSAIILIIIFTIIVIFKSVLNRIDTGWLVFGGVIAVHIGFYIFSQGVRK